MTWWEFSNCPGMLRLMVSRGFASKTEICYWYREMVIVHRENWVFEPLGLGGFNFCGDDDDDDDHKNNNNNNNTNRSHCNIQ